MNTTGSGGSGGHGGEAFPRVAGSRPIHKGRKFSFEMLTVELSGGRRVEREIVRHPGAVTILPILERAPGISGPAVVLIRNFRMAPARWLLELPAGTLEPGEPPEVTAGRELEEETGYRAATLEPLGWFYTTPGMTDERMFAFAARGLSAVPMRLEEDEAIRVEVTAASALDGLIASGELTDAKSMLTILLAQRRGLLPAPTETA